MQSLPDSFAADELSVTVSDLLVATPDDADPRLDQRVSEGLRLLRQSLRVDAVFVAEIVEQQRVTRWAAGSAALPVVEGERVPLEATYCKAVLEGRLPPYIPDLEALAGELSPDLGEARIRGHVTTPITLDSGRLYGTLCCVTAGPMDGDGQRTLALLQRCAQWVSKALSRAGVQ